MQKTSIIAEIIAFIFGRQYFANIVATNGTARCEIASYIFTSKEAAERHRLLLVANASYRFIETVSFRSRIDYSSSTTFTSSRQ